MKHYTAQQLAKRWGCHFSSVHRRASAGDLRPIKIRGDHYFSEEDVKLMESVSPIRKTRQGKERKKRTPRPNPETIQRPLDRFVNWLRALFCK